MLSETDIIESRNLGAFAAVSAIRGESGKMSALKRICDDPYQVEIVLFLGVMDEKKLPEWAQKGLEKAKEMHAQEKKPAKERGDAR